MAVKWHPWNKKPEPATKDYYRHRCGPGKRDRHHWYQLGVPNTCPGCGVEVHWPGRVSKDSARWVYSIYQIIEWP